MKTQINEIERMQQLAGIIKENQLKSKKILSEDIDFQQFRNSDEIGWMEITMEEIANKQDLDLSYRSDFEIAFEEAIKTLKSTQPQLNFNLIEKFKENMF